MTRDVFKAVTLQDLKDACFDKDVQATLSILVEDFAQNADNQKPYNFSPTIVQTIGNIARDDANNGFLKDLLNALDSEFPDIDDLHLAVRDGANELLNNEDMISFIDNALSHMNSDSDIVTIDNDDDDYYMGDGSDLTGIDDDPYNRFSDLDFNV